LIYIKTLKLFKLGNIYFIGARISAAYRAVLRSKVSSEAGESVDVLCGVFWGLSVAIRLEKYKERDIDAADDQR